MSNCHLRLGNKWLTKNVQFVLSIASNHRKTGVNVVALVNRF